MAEPQELNLQQIKDRDEGALHELFEYLFPRLKRLSYLYARRYGRNVLDADDLAHEALLKIYTHLDKAPLEEISHFLAWCDVVMRNLILDNVRRMRRRDLECEHFESEASFRTPEMSTANFEGLDAIRTREILEVFLNNLSQEDRELDEFRLNGITLTDVANERGQTRDQIYRRYNHVINKLRRQLQSELDTK